MLPAVSPRRNNIQVFEEVTEISCILLAQYQELCSGLCKTRVHLRDLQKIFLAKKNCVRGTLNQGLGSTAEGGRGELADPQVA